MRLAFVVHDYSRAVGHGRYVVELASRLARAHEVHVFANTFDPRDAGAIRAHRVPALRASALATVLTFPVSLAARLSRDFDLVHSQGFSSFRFDVVTAHICNQTWFEALRALEPEQASRSALFNRLVTPIERWVYARHPQAWVIAISQKVRSDLATAYGRTERVEVIHHGIELDRFSPEGHAARGAELRRRWATEGQPVLLFVGDLRKGARAAMQTLARIPRAVLVLVSRSRAGPWQDLARELGVSDRVRFESPADAIEEVYAAADVFLFPTPYDAFGMVITEAMAMQVPVVTTRAAGASEVITHEETGFLVDGPADIDQLTRHVQALLADPSLRLGMGRRARERVLSSGWDAVTAATEKVYERALAERRR